MPLTIQEKFMVHARALQRLGEIEFMSTEADATRLVMKRSHACTFCGVAHFIFVNRNGRTRCWDCDSPPVAAASASSAVRDLEVKA